MTDLEKRFEEVKNHLDDNTFLYWEEETGGLFSTGTAIGPPPKARNSTPTPGPSLS
jgi:hypothetical protein